MIENKGDLRTMFLCLWDVFNTYSPKTELNEKQKTCLEDATEFFRQMSVISKNTEKKMINERGFTSDIKSLYVMFYPKFAAFVAKEKNITAEYLRKKISEFIRKGKLERKNKKILVLMMDGLYEVCREM
jgi:hypothetical protein